MLQASSLAIRSKFSADKADTTGANGERQSILTWLSRLDVEKKQSGVLSKRLAGTCEWILQTPEFVEWSSGQSESPILWCHGLPGIGKTTVFSVVIDHLRKTLTSPKSALAYVYCDWDKRAELSAHVLLSSLCKQLAEQSEELPPHLVKHYRQMEPAGERLNIDELMLIIIALCISFEKVIICVEGLNECDEGEGPIMTAKLKWLKNHGARILITTGTHGDLPEKCPCHDDITAAFMKEGRLELQSSKEDMKTFLKEQLRNHQDGEVLLTRTQETADDLAEKIVTDSGGMFVAAQLKLERMLRRLPVTPPPPSPFIICFGPRILLPPPPPPSPPPSSRRRRRRSNAASKPPPPLVPVPTILPPQYNLERWDEGLQTIQVQQPSRRILAMATLRWVIYAKDPLYLQELVQVLSVELHQIYPFGFFVDGSDILLPGPAARRETTAEELRILFQRYRGQRRVYPTDAELEIAISFDVCEGLVCVRGDNDEVCLSEGWVLSRMKVDELFPDAHRHIAGACLQFLSRTDVLESNRIPVADERGRVPPEPWVPFKRYAERYWEDHYSSAGDDEELDEVAMAYFRKLWNCPASWVEERQPLFRDKYHVMVTDDETPLIKTARLGLNRILERFLIEGHYDIDFRTSKAETAISAALMAGHVSTVRLLYRYGASLHHRNDYGDSLLHMAAEKDDEVMVALLIGTGLPVDTLSDGNNRVTALSRAAANNCVNAGRVLLDEGAHVYEHNVIEEAVNKGHEEIVKLLFERGYNPSAPLLTAAVRSGSLSMVKLLIQNGADPCQIDDENVHPAMHAAADDGYLDIVKLLFEHGADPFRVRRVREGVMDYFNKTALELAMLREYQDVVDFLVSRIHDDLPRKTIMGIAATAIKQKSPDLAKICLGQISGDLVHEKRDFENTVLGNAIAADDKGMLEFLFSRGLPIVIGSKGGREPIHAAASQGKINATSILLEHGADANAITVSGLTPLHDAAYSGHVEVLELLLDWGVDLEVQAIDGSTALVAAGASGWCEDLPGVARLLLQYGAPVSKANLDGETVLHYAVMDNNISLVQDILAHGVDLSIRSRRGGSALHFAAFKGHIDIVKQLLAHEADTELGHEFHGDEFKPPGQDEDRPSVPWHPTGMELECRPRNWGPIEKQWKALHSAAFGGHAPIIKILLQYGAKVSSRDEVGNTPLHIAASAGKLDVAKVLLEYGADIHARNESGDTPLHSAALAVWAKEAEKVRDQFKCCCHLEKEANAKGHDHSKSDCIELLLEHGADVACENLGGLTPLAVAVVAGHEDIVNILIDKAPPKLYSPEAYAKLLRSCEASSSAAILETISNACIETEESISAWNQILKNACKDGNQEMVSLAIHKGAGVILMTVDGIDLLHQAIRDEHVQIVGTLLAAGADVNATDGTGRNALHIASSNPEKSTLTVHHDSRKKKQIVKYLFKCGAEAHCRTWGGDTALHFAVNTGVPGLVDLLLRSGASVNIRNKRGWTPLHSAVTTWVFPDIVEMLLRNGACPTAQDKAGYTPMHLFRDSSENGKLIFDMLLKKGGKPSIPARNGDQPIHCAIRRSEWPIFTWLLKAGATVHDRGANNRTVLHIAAKHNKAALIEPLINSGANPYAVDDDGWMPIHYAVHGQHSKVVSNLLSKGGGAKVATVPLSSVLHEGDTEVTRILLDAGYDLGGRVRMNE
jgi:ankyrin repeat protein